MDLLILERIEDRASLPDALWITPQQVGLLLGGRSVEQLEDDRKAGTGPKWSKPFGERGAVRYRLGAVRDFMINTPEFSNMLEMRIALGSSALLTFSDFLDRGTLDDTWPFLLREGVPVDFFKSLTLGDALTDDDRAVVLTLDGYLTQRLAAGRQAKVAAERAELLAAADSVKVDDNPLPRSPGRRHSP
ncbi:hypothetical protein [Burkholderia sp. LMG 13014]|uniref:hypothetical protein n=1 Tax=Burkholderia sp. LMG 13014 TaxID=2709306 RepID=UPI001966AA1C|nr:hypothetical protein [Burkholderia sp. LMG 13014]